MPTALASPLDRSDPGQPAQPHEWLADIPRYHASTHAVHTARDGAIRRAALALQFTHEVNQDELSNRAEEILGAAHVLMAHYQAQWGKSPGADEATYEALYHGGDAVLAATSPIFVRGSPTAAVILRTH